MSEVSVTNITRRTIGVGRSVGYAVGNKTYVVEDGETKTIPLSADDPRLVGDKVGGLIEVKAVAPAKASPKDETK